MFGIRRANNWAPRFSLFTLRACSSATAKYDLAVIGGGSGGMACAKEAARNGARVVLFDYVMPSATRGSKWGLGGTCVNVGCVPKKMMHYAGLLGSGFEDARNYGWDLPASPTHNWSKLVETVQNQIKQLNFSYRSGLMNADVKYINAKAHFTDPNTVEYTDRTGERKSLSADKFVLAVGGRPDIPSDVTRARKFAITSDDIFSLKKAPGRTLIVGGSYIALETASFLRSLGYPVTVAVRSILLRGYDRQCAEKVGALMAAQGVRFLNRFTPHAFTQLDRGSLEVKLKRYQSGENSEDSQDLTIFEEFDTVMFATGRNPDTAYLNLPATGVEFEKNGKIFAPKEQTNVPHIYAVGDIVKDREELTPLAIASGELLARRLFAGATEHLSEAFVPSTVFTSFEYGFVGLSEEDAVRKYGEDDLEIYLSEFSTLEIGAAHRKSKEPLEMKLPENIPKIETEPSTSMGEIAEEFPATCLAKLICLKSEKQRVVGLHFVGPNAGEVTQGFTLGLMRGATKSDFDKLIGIHPTDAEVFSQMTVTKRSGESYLTSGCGGGKCG
eukprot:233075_1